MKGALPDARRHSPAVPRGLDGVTALVVDDDRAVRLVLEMILSHAGCAVLAAPDGESALEAVARLERPVDLLVTDVFMPGMTGWELAERLNGRWPELKTIVLSGALDEPRRPPGPGSAFLQKPVGPELLLERARRLLERA